MRALRRSYRHELEWSHNTLCGRGMTARSLAHDWAAFFLSQRTFALFLEEGVSPSRKFFACYQGNSFGQPARQDPGTISLVALYESE
jgi:hypothetical protein